MFEKLAVLGTLPPEKMLLYGILLALPILPNLWSIWHAYYRQFPSDTEKMIWMGLSIFVPVLGGLAYLLFGFRRSRRYDRAVPVNDKP